MENLLNLENIGLETIITASLYLTLSGLYLLIIPAGVYFYLNQRWYVASSFERAFMYFMVFFSFPGMLLLSPFLNFRPRRRELS
ncbi:NAD(P)H-quinone oxidoreductase subunit L [Cyanobacterium sp. Dongsha4]|uniref:NAD(P)H-quinone oxidoreductase subunit L n=1 Tax=Cyanobacterium sp. DS4 TaxID=2878255 RepID=UPI002E80BFE1|nr:NAD(P)H-quinone oxidoreductase subunit L [Cyanobacterium sp. Dongsha4]WVL00156.1 NAD(P)H-quinone oxidoreductase subunit L [Cyanobacterium sp. Dongsha4]